jgi:ribosomal-protein-alanine N-acetyltransferase
MTDDTTALETPLLRLVPATSASVAAELQGLATLAEILDAVMPPDWPPEHHDSDTLRFWRHELSQPGADGWWLHYIVLADADSRTLVGTAGYKGPPKDRVVEIGYSVVPSWQRQGLATEACRALIESAWQRGAETVIAHTLSDLEPSLGVLRTLGFVPCESREPDAVAFELRQRT